MARAPLRDFSAAWSDGEAPLSLRRRIASVR
jgi:hypothetical protein